MLRFLRTDVSKAAAFLVVTVVVLAVTFLHKDRLLQGIVRGDVIQTQLPPTSSPYIYSWPKCQQNMSAAKIKDFSSLPSKVQDFLYYYHCQHFSMLLDIPDKCGGPDGSAEVFLLLVIKSSPANFDRREILRKTWAKERLHNGLWIRTVFISGTMGVGFEKERLNKLLEIEQRENNDILQWEFSDTFFNLSLKQVLFLEWMERNCPYVRFLLNGDDDVFANTDNMVEYLQHFEKNGGQKHLFTGYILENTGPVRDPYSKYYVPVQVQESDSYPPYCSGGGYLLSGYTALIIYNVSHSVSLHPIDDVFMGMCLAKAGLRPESHEGMRITGLYLASSKADGYDPCFYRETLLVHRFLSAHMYLMWHQIHDPNLKCPSSD